MTVPRSRRDKAAQEAQAAANARATTAYYTIGGVGLVGAAVVLAVVASRRKGKKA